MKRLLIIVALLAGCEDKPPAPPTEVDAGPAPTVKGPAPPIDFEPIPSRLALPVKVRAMRLPEGSVGAYRDQELKQPARLMAVGLNLCQTGFVLQGYIERDGELAVTPALAIPRDVLPTEPTTIFSPRIPDQMFHLDLQEASMARLKGTVRILQKGSADEVMRMVIDAEPIGITTGPGLGAQGCFTTGSYDLELGDQQRQGPVSAVYDGKRLHYVGMRLTEKYGIGVWLHLEPTHRQPQNVIRGDLATVGEKPKRFPFRVVFETRTMEAGAVVVHETPATEGDLMAAFVKANPQGPIRIELENLKFPDWDGPLSGVTVDRVRTEAMIVTDIEGVGVPVPSSVQERAKRPGSPSALPDAAPGQTDQK